MTGLRPTLVGLGIAGLLAGLALMLVPMSESGPSRGAYASPWLPLVIGWAFIGTGQFAWLRRPDNRIGPLMTAVGFAWFVASLIGSEVTVLNTIGLFGGSVWAALLIHMTLSFPSGRLRTRAERRVVAAAYFVTIVLQVPPLLFGASDSLTCRGCPSHLAPFERNPGVADVLFTLQLVCIVAVLVVASAMVVQRWRHATGRQRQALGTVLASSGAAGLLAALAAGSSAVGLHGFSGAIDWAYLAAAASVPFVFLAGLLRSRLHRADAVVELIERLAEAPRPGQLRDALAKALGDLSLTVAYWLADENRYVDSAARPIELPSAGSTRVATVIELEGRRVAAIVHDASLSEEPELVHAAGAAAALGLERERLEAELRARLHELGASRTRIVEAGDVERRRLERDLHDGAQQRLVSLLLSIKLARRGNASTATVDEPLLDTVETELVCALADLRSLASGILPPVLTDYGLEAAIEELASRSSVEIRIGEMPAERFPDHIEVAAYFVILEALTNVAKYAEVGHARVRAARANGRAVVEIADDGVGGVDSAAGSGIRGLADRVGALGGRLDVDSPRGRGTTVRASIPIGC